ncbi:MAG: SCO family protein [Ignavibacteria bacterium]|nr:SCO family protein [Ignavibacteria bacterium]
MKTYLKTILTVVILFVALTTGYFLITSSSNEKVLDKDEAKGKSSCCGDEITAHSSVSETSIYQTSAVWRDQENDEFMLKEIEGKRVVMALFFSNCSYACPIILNDMQKIEEKLSDREIGSSKFILVSIDPDRDTPQRLKEFALSKKINMDRWKLVTGTNDDVLELAALLGFKYRKEDNGDFSHTNMIVILDSKGDIIHTHLGLNKDMSLATSVFKNLSYNQ